MIPLTDYTTPATNSNLLPCLRSLRCLLHSLANHALLPTLNYRVVRTAHRQRRTMLFCPLLGVSPKGKKAALKYTAWTTAID